MKLASLKSSSKDGTLVIVSQDHKRYTPVEDIAATMQDAIERWDIVAANLYEQSELLNSGKLAGEQITSMSIFAAPLPRAWQWLDGSAFLNHSQLMEKAYNVAPIKDLENIPLVYQGAGHNFADSSKDIDVINQAYGLDFEGEFGVIVDEVPAGCSAQDALSHIKLIVLLNDISYRAFGPREMGTGFGFVQAKGETAFAPFAVTPDELATSWKNGKVCLPLNIDVNGQWFGNPHGGEMHFGFEQIIAHAATSRTLCAGTVIGSGTVSNAADDVGQACIAELRAREIIKHGSAETAFLTPGDRIQIEAIDEDGQSVFGSINQKVK